jgi:alpha-N-arabinofuranosidase
MADIPKPMHPMKSQTIRTLLPLAMCAPLWAQSTSLTIDAAKPLGKVSPTHHGLMTEEINYCYDGGLYAELIRNRAFLDDPKEPVRWSAIAGAKIGLDASQPLSKALPVSLKLDAAAAGDGVSNSGYWGFPVKPSTTYRARFRAKAAPGFKGALKVAIQARTAR